MTEGTPFTGIQTRPKLYYTSPGSRWPAPKLKTSTSFRIHHDGTKDLRYKNGAHINWGGMDDIESYNNNQLINLLSELRPDT